MTAATKGTIEGIGGVLRWVTPLLILALGFFMSRELDQIDRVQLEHSQKFDALTGRVGKVENIVDDVQRHERKFNSLDNRVRRLELGGGP